MLRLLRGNQEAGMLRRDVYMRLEQHAEPREPVCSVLLKQQWHMDMTWRPPSVCALLHVVLAHRLLLSSISILELVEGSA